MSMPFKIQRGHGIDVSNSTRTCMGLSIFSAVLRGRHLKMLFKEMIKVANGFKMQFVGDHRGGHVGGDEQLLGVLQLDFINVLRNRAAQVFFKQPSKV